MAAGKDHTELAIPDLIFEEHLVHGIGRRPFGFQQDIHIGGERALQPFAPDRIDRLTLGYHHEPARRIVRDDAKAPVFQRLVKGILEYIFCQFQVVDTEIDSSVIMTFFFWVVLHICDMNSRPSPLLNTYMNMCGPKK